MSTENRWLLPEGIDELLPERAAQLEALRRRLLDQCATWGYRYVIPPLVEFTDSLLIGLGADLDVVTCKFTDQMSGRMLGVRADITPQTARMDAHSLAEEGVTRLCYAGSTLQSTPQSVISGRAPIQLGAELFGSSAIEADSEIIGLMLSTFQCAGVSRRTFVFLCLAVGTCNSRMVSQGARYILQPISRASALVNAFTRIFGAISKAVGNGFPVLLPLRYDPRTRSVRPP